MASLIKLNYNQNYSFCLFVCGISKPNQTTLIQTNQTKLKQSKPKTIYSVQTFPTINSKLTASNKFKSKVTEKLPRAAQLLYIPLLVWTDKEKPFLPLWQEMRCVVQFIAQSKLPTFFSSRYCTFYTFFKFFILLESIDMSCQE